MHVIQVDVTKENDINRALEYITKKLPQKGSVFFSNYVLVHIKNRS